MIKSQATKEAERDEVLDTLQRARADLIRFAEAVADSLFIKNGTVTSTEVLDYLRTEESPEIKHALSSVDPRFLGAVFRKGKGWKRLGYAPTGSHARPVAIWTK
jgi:hypothetical protein